MGRAADDCDTMDSSPGRWPGAVMNSPFPHDGAAPSRGGPAGPRPRNSAVGGTRLDLDVDPRRQAELVQRIDGLIRGLNDVDQPLVRADLELLPRLLVDVRAAEDRVA